MILWLPLMIIQGVAGDDVTKKQSSEIIESADSTITLAKKANEKLDSLLIKLKELNEKD